MSLKAKRMALSKTTKIVLKGNRGVANNVNYRGVQMRDSGRYYAQIKDPLKQTRVWPGTFDTSVEVAKAYDAAAIMFRGMKALMNFPIPASSVNIPPRKNSFVDSVNGMLAVISPLPLALSFRTSYSFSSSVSPPIV